jgi:hypothetical protein
MFRIEYREGKKFNNGREYTFEQGDEVSFNSFLQGTDGARLESQVSLEILSDFSDETLKSTINVSYDSLMDGEYTEVCE